MTGRAIVDHCTKNTYRFLPFSLWPTLKNTVFFGTLPKGLAMARKV
jgi:hypothetical protein